jgi:hypothetical protein
MAPLTAILSKLPEEKVDDPQYHWWTKILASQKSTGTAGAYIYTDATLATACSGAISSGDTVFVKMTAAHVAHFRVGHVVTMRDASDYRCDANGKVTAVQVNGSSSYCAVKMLEDENQGTGMTTIDQVLITGNVNPEGGTRPEAISYDPVKWYNYTQIFRTPMEITRTARETRLRTGDAYKEAKRECLELHSIEMEKAFLWGYRSEGTGSNGKPERTTMGLIRAIQYGSDGTANVGVTNDYVANATYSGQTWLQGGEDWLDEQLEQIFRYGRPEKLAFAGSGALLGIQRLAKASGQIQLTPVSTSYGIKVLQWITPFGVINVKTHPLFSFESTNLYSMVIFEPEDLRYRYVTDTMFRKAPPDNQSQVEIDGTVEEYLTECGLEYHHPNGWAYLNGFNQTNTA